MGIRENHTQERLIIKNYTVFHASQIEGISPYVPPKFDIDKKAERIIDESRAKISHKGVRAFYNFNDDCIQVPARWKFKTQYGYYATIFHELGHWTGHTARLNREQTGDKDSFIYAKEELVAEIASMFISAETGIKQTQEHFDNHAAYIASWIKGIEEDNKVLFWAIRQAQKASDEILKYEHIREQAGAGT